MQGRLRERREADAAREDAYAHARRETEARARQLGLVAQDRFRSRMAELHGYDSHLQVTRRASTSADREDARVAWLRLIPAGTRRTRNFPEDQF